MMMFSDTASCHLLWGQSTRVKIQKEALDISLLSTTQIQVNFFLFYGTIKQVIL
jgi:hypothetical protein